jgi:hypothetical protein
MSIRKNCHTLLAITGEVPIKLNAPLLPGICPQNPETSIREKFTSMSFWGNFNENLGNPEF